MCHSKTKKPKKKTPTKKHHNKSEEKKAASGRKDSGKKVMPYPLQRGTRGVDTKRRTGYSGKKK